MHLLDFGDFARILRNKIPIKLSFSSVLCLYIIFYYLKINLSTLSLDAGCFVRLIYQGVLAIWPSVILVEDAY